MQILRPSCILQIVFMHRVCVEKGRREAESDCVSCGCRYIYRVDPQLYFGLSKTTPPSGPPAALEFDTGSVTSTGNCGSLCFAFQALYCRSWQKTTARCKNHNERSSEDENSAFFLSRLPAALKFDIGTVTSPEVTRIIAFLSITLATADVDQNTKRVKTPNSQMTDQI